MFLKVIWNRKLQQSSLYVSDLDSNVMIENTFQDFEVVISFPLKENISINFVQNFIAFNEFNFSYLDEQFFWLENISLTKNILSFFSAISLISLDYDDLVKIDKFCLLHNVPLNDLKNLGYQSPVKTIPRDLSTKPNFMNHFLNIGDVSKRLLRTTFYFNEKQLSLYINKRIVSPKLFFNHLNSNRDRIRISESLSQPFNDTLGFIDFISELSIYKSLAPLEISFLEPVKVLEEINLIKNETIQLPFINFLDISNVHEETSINLNNNSLIEEEDLTEDFIVQIEQTLVLNSNHNSVDEIFSDEIKNNDNIAESLSVEDLVDSINDIIEETFSLELEDIVDLPIIIFLSNSLVESNEIDTNIKEILVEDLIDNFFLENDSNLEINDFSAKEVIDIVNTKVSIFENNNSIIEDVKIPESLAIKENENSSTVNEEIINAIVENTLEKTNTVNIEVQPFILFLDIKKSLLLDRKESVIIINFLLSVNIVNNILEDDNNENIENNFNFIEENQKKLIELSMEGNIEGVIDLYNNYPDFEKPLINFNYEGDNPLCIASFNENLDLLSKLIDYGWNPNYFDSNLNNALIIACAEGHKHIVKYLLTQSLQINFQNKKGYTALHFAVNDCNHRIVKLLIEAGSDVELSDNDRNTPLSIAAFKGDINSTKLLLQTRINVHTKNKKGYDARAIALLAKNHAIAKLIEDKIVSEKHNHSLPPIIEKNIE